MYLKIHIQWATAMTEMEHITDNLYFICVKKPLPQKMSRSYFTSTSKGKTEKLYYISIRLNVYYLFIYLFIQLLCHECKVTMQEKIKK